MTPSAGTVSPSTVSSGSPPSGVSCASASGTSRVVGLWTVSGLQGFRGEVRFFKKESGENWGHHVLTTEQLCICSCSGPLWVDTTRQRRFKSACFASSLKKPITNKKKSPKSRDRYLLPGHLKKIRSYNTWAEQKTCQRTHLH